MLFRSLYLSLSLQSDVMPRNPGGEIQTHKSCSLPSRSPTFKLGRKCVFQSLSSVPLDGISLSSRPTSASDCAVPEMHGMTQRGGFIKEAHLVPFTSERGGDRGERRGGAGERDGSERVCAGAWERRQEREISNLPEFSIMVKKKPHELGKRMEEHSEKIGRAHV